MKLASACLNKLAFCLPVLTTGGFNINTNYFKSEGKELKKISWFTVIVVVMIAAMMFVAGCGSKDAAPAGDSDSGDSPGATVPTISGERFETETVSMIVADGWDVMDINGGLQAYKGISKAVEVWVRGSGLADDAGKKSMENFANNYDGTAVEEVEMFGLTFFSTTFEFSGMKQTKYGSIKNGQQIEITLAGEDHLEDEEIMGMFYSIEFK